MPLQYKINVVQSLKSNGYNTNKIRIDRLLSESTMTKLRRQLPVSWENLDTLCRLLRCQPGDILEYVEDAPDE